MEKLKNNLGVISVALLIVNLVVIGLYLRQNTLLMELTTKVSTQENEITALKALSQVTLPIATTSPTLIVTSSPKTPVVTSAPPRQIGVETIKYTLPENWKASYANSGLQLTRDGGGYLFITAYTYNGLGRREYYCSINKYCIASTTFSPYTIGNISGYIAQGLDNSGGGSEYFGAKGSSFYIVGAYNGAYEPEKFVKEVNQIMKSLLF